MIFMMGLTFQMVSLSHAAQFIFSDAKTGQDIAADFFVAIGRNTRYIIHPEEVLAENFVIVMLGREDLPNPEVPKRLKEWLEEK